MTSPHFIADLHLHSTASDGELAPHALMQQCHEKGLSCVTLSDHDSLAGIADAQKEAKRLGMEFIPGCELTGYLNGTELHLLSLFIDPSPTSPVAKLVDDVRIQRPKRAYEITAKLRSLGVPLEDADVEVEIRNSYSPGRAHIAAAMVKKGFVKSMNEAFFRYLAPTAPAYLPKVSLEPKQIIDTVHASQGIVILAHPGFYKRDELIPQLFKMGLDGLEIYHHSHSAEMTVHYRELAKAHEGVVSGGSDFHGPRMKPGVSIRSAGCTQEMLDALKARQRQVAQR